MPYLNLSKSKVLVIYKRDQCYTNNVFENINSINSANTFLKNKIKFDYIDSDEINKDFNNNLLNKYHAIGIHYTVRLPYNQVPEKIIEFLSGYKGLSFLFLQDEYNNTFRAHYWIKRLKIKLVFTCVPQENIEKIYPFNDFLYFLKFKEKNINKARRI